MSMLWKLLWHLVVLLATLVIGAWYFRAVAPPTIAYLIAGALVVAELGGMLVLGRHGGGRLVLVKAAVPLLVFPALAWGLEALTHWQWYTTMPIAAAAACAVGTAGARHGSGHDSKRLAETAVAVAIPLYSLAYVTVAGAPPIGLACAVGAMAVAPLVVKVAVTWPGRHEDVLVYASAGAAAWAIVIALMGTLAGAL